MTYTYTTAKEAFINYMAVSGKTSDSISSYSNTLKRFGMFLAHHGIEILEDISPLDISNYMAYRKDAISAYSLRLELTHLRGFFKYMVGMRLLASSPITPSHTVSKSALREERSKEYDKIITEEEFLSILTNDHPANTYRSQVARNRALLILFLTTGLRNESVRELRVGDLNFDSGIVHVSKAKGGKSGDVPFTDLAQRFVRMYLDGRSNLTDSDYLFGFGRKGQWVPFSRQQMSNTVAAAIKSYLPERTGIRSHALRHSFASLMFNARHGLTEDEIGTILLHSDGTGASVTSRYIKVDMSRLFAKVNAIFNEMTAKLSFSA